MNRNISFLSNHRLSFHHSIQNKYKRFSSPKTNFKNLYLKFFSSIFDISIWIRYFFLKVLLKRKWMNLKVFQMCQYNIVLYVTCDMLMFVLKRKEKKNEHTHTHPYSDFVDWLFARIWSKIIRGFKWIS